MLSTFLTQIQTLQNLFSKYFFLGSFCPLLASVFLNGLAGYFIFDPWHRFVDANIRSANFAEGTFATIAIGVGIALGAYVLSALSTFSRQMLEGRGPLWNSLARFFIPAQNRRKERLIADLDDVGMDLTDLRESPDWLARLQAAWAFGSQQHPNVTLSMEPDPLADQLRQLRKVRDLTRRLTKQPLRKTPGSAQTLSQGDVRSAITVLTNRLSEHDADADGYLASQHHVLVELIRDAFPVAQQAPLIQQLQTARNIGTTQQPGKLCGLLGPVAYDIDCLDKRRAHYKPINIDKLETAINGIEACLKSGDADADYDLARQHEKLTRLIRYAKARAEQRQVRLRNELNSNYGLQDVAPTRMGNIANSIQSYALRRYHCNLESVWSNLQVVAAKDEKAPATLVVAKTQLDFLVNCTWLSFLSTFAWIAVFTWLVPGRTGFLIVAVAGPILSYLWYRAAAEQYRSVADLMMTTLDTYRLDLLRQMRLPLPTDVEQEREMWRRLDLISTFGEVQNFQYRHPPEQPSQ